MLFQKKFQEHHKEQSCEFMRKKIANSKNAG